MCVNRIIMVTEDSTGRPWIAGKEIVKMGHLADA